MALPRPCALCGRPYRKRCGCPGARAALAVRQAKLPRAARGYGAEYESQRRELQSAIHKSRSAGREVYCAICGTAIHGPWSAEHDPPLMRFTSPDAWVGRLLPAHPSCNYARRNTR